ncbi:MAG TPA: hypothetical protein VMS65_14490 [Polyangiaceae bacterium]|nr:hypothetical protein [Polyangiaceae bacterium]
MDVTGRTPPELSDGQLQGIAAELRGITHGSSWARTLATGELLLKHFFGGKLEEWRTHRRQKEASIRRLAQRPDCPLGRSALSDAVSIYAAKKHLPRCVDELTPSHVAIALRLPPAQRLLLIEKAVAQAWSVREMRNEALLLKRRAGERRGRPRFSQARAAFSQIKASLVALDSGIELLRVAGEIDPDTTSLFERSLDVFEAKVDIARARLTALGRPGIKSGPTASLIVPAAKGRLAG